jgi:hypothetical protein
VTFLAAESFDFGNGHSFDADLTEGIFHFFQLERFYDCFDFLHSLFGSAEARRQSMKAPSNGGANEF